MIFEFDELCECDNETKRLKAILDPLTIITNIIININMDDNERFIHIIINKVIINISNLNIIIMIFFRHQHILINLIINIIFIIMNFLHPK